MTTIASDIRCPQCGMLLRPHVCGEGRPAQVCPVCSGEGRVYRMTAAYEAMAGRAPGGMFSWAGPTHEWRTCRVCDGAGLLK